MVYTFMIWARLTTLCALILSSIKTLSRCMMCAKTWTWQNWIDRLQLEAVTHRGTYQGSRARGWARRHRQRQLKTKPQCARLGSPVQSHGRTSGRPRNRTIRTSCWRLRKETCRRCLTYSTLQRRCSKSLISTQGAQTSGLHCIMRPMRATATS